MEYKVFGCRLNKYFLNKWRKYFEKNNMLDSRGLLLASCVVTDRSKSKWIRLIKNNINNGKKIYLTGCAVLENGKLMGKSKFFEIYTDLQQYAENIVFLSEDPENNQFSIESKGNLYTKNFIIIQKGCDNHCSFCMTVKKRGKSISFNKNSIIDQIKKIEETGAKEIVLTGVNIASWGTQNTKDYNNTKFAFLLENILKQTKIPRIRLSSLGPQYLNEDFFQVIENERIMPHFHLSIQSFSDNVLKNMGRPYRFVDLENLISKFRSLNRKDSDYINIAADIIVGFPGETDDNFDKTYEGVSKAKLSKLHIFPFSPHKNYESVPASDFSNKIDRKILKERKNKLLELGETLKNEFIEKNIGEKWEVMLEEERDGVWKGWTPNYLQQEIEGDYEKGDLIEIDFIHNEKG